MTFDNALKSTLNNEIAHSENGAAMFRTSGHALVDLNFAVSSLRNASADEVVKMFSDAFYEDKLLAVKWLFFARDIRGNGMGERRLFRICMSWLGNVQPELVKRLIPLAAEYGRFDDILGCGFEGELWDSAVDCIAEQLKNDIDNADAGKPISLLAKWLPSVNTSSSKTRALAKKLYRSLGMDERTYRKTLSKLRGYSNVLEVKLSAKEWGAVNYDAVPSQANIKYKNAFLKNDEQRRREWLGKLEKGEAKINASAAFPCDIVHKYSSTGWNWREIKKDAALEAMWKALPDYVSNADAGSTIVVADGSGSMTCSVGSGTMTALEVANSLAIYFSERLPSEFKDKYITFSGRPQYVDMSNANSLCEKINIALRHDEVANTNIEAVFDLLLATATQHHLEQSQIPANVLIVSDMEFDDAVEYNRYSYSIPKNTLFGTIRQKWENTGYKLPKLVFWNVNSRTKTIPVQQNSMGVALVSGFSPAIAKMVFSAKTDPYDIIVEALNAPRYKPVEDAFNSN